MHEVVHSIHSKKKAMILKLDMEKANDRVNWFFMDQILKRFGFATKWRLWI